MPTVFDRQIQAAENDLEKADDAVKEWAKYGGANEDHAQTMALLSIAQSLITLTSILAAREEKR